MSGEAQEKPNVYVTLCRLLAAWVHDVAWEPSGPTDFEALLQAADRHSLSAAACFALEHAGLLAQCPAETARRFQEWKVLSLRKTLLMDAERKQLTAFLDENGIWYAPLKGAVLNGMYPQYGARQFADCDILFDASRWEDVCAFMTGRGYKVRHLGHGAHDTYQKPPVYIFEMHRRLFEPEGKSILAACAGYYEDVAERLVPDGNGGAGLRFRDEDFYVYFLAHAYKHYSVGGTGLRTVLDVYLYRRSRPDMDGAYIAGELEKLGLTSFAALFSSLGEKLFAAPDRPALTPAEQQALDWITASGVYGTWHHRVQTELRQMQGADGPISRRVRAKFLFRRVFPDWEWYRVNVPYVWAHRWAVPFYWVYRLCRGIFVNGSINRSIASSAAGRERKDPGEEAGR